MSQLHPKQTADSCQPSCCSPISYQQTGCFYRRWNWSLDRSSPKYRLPLDVILSDNNSAHLRLCCFCFHKEEIFYFNFHMFIQSSKLRKTKYSFKIMTFNARQTVSPKKLATILKQMISDLFRLTLKFHMVRHSDNQFIMSWRVLLASLNRTISSTNMR